MGFRTPRSIGSRPCTRRSPARLRVTNREVSRHAEVHAIDIKKPEVTGLASFSQCDLREPAQIDETIAKIGKIVNALFNCAGLPNTFPELDVMLVNFCGLRQVTESVIPLMIDGSS